MRVVGLDVSSTCTGVADARGRTCLVQPRTKGVGSRLDETVTGVIRALGAGGGADMAVIEGYNPRGAQGFTMCRLAEAGGIVRWALWRDSVKIVELAPTSLKKLATGHGNADKDAVRAAATTWLGYEGKSYDEADALWAREAALQAYSSSSVTLPAEHLEALKAVRWPS